MSDRMIIQKKLEGPEIYTASVKFSNNPAKSELLNSDTIIVIDGGDKRASLKVEYDRNAQNLFSSTYNTGSLNLLKIDNAAKEYTIEYKVFDYDNDGDSDLIVKVIKSSTDIEYYLFENRELLHTSSPMRGGSYYDTIPIP